MSAVRLVFPLVVATVLAVVATATHRRLRPNLAAPLLTVAIAAVTFAIVPAVAVIALGYFAHRLELGGALEWCGDVLGMHAPVPPWLGLPALIVAALAAVRTRAVLRSWRHFRRVSSDGVETATSDALFAYTLPGAGGQIIVSSNLLAELDADELAVVLSHEQAHARHRHDRHVLVAAVADALMPLVRPLQRRLLFTLERWADEEAVAASGGNRTMVACTLARVALSRDHDHGPAPATAVARLGVAGRVEALLDPPALARPRLWIALMGTGIFAVLGAGVVQLHHIAPLVAALCPG